MSEGNLVLAWGKRRLVDVVALLVEEPCTRISVTRQGGVGGVYKVNVSKVPSRGPDGT